MEIVPNKDKFDLVVEEIGSLKEKIIIFACNQLDMEGALDKLIGAENRTELRERLKNNVIKDITEQTLKQQQFVKNSIIMMMRPNYYYAETYHFSLAGYKHHEFIYFSEFPDDEYKYIDHVREYSKEKYNYRMKICNRDTHNPDDECFLIHKMTFLK